VRVAKNHSNSLRENLETRWKALVAYADAVMAEWRSGKAMARYRREAAQEVLRLNTGANLSDVIETLLALYSCKIRSHAGSRATTGFEHSLSGA